MALSKENFVKDFLTNKTVYTINRSSFFEKTSSFAFVYKQEEEFAGKSYNINIDSQIDENSLLYKFLLMHESGHIIYNHVSNNTVFNKDILNAKIKVIYNVLSQKYPSLKKENVESAFKSYVLNIITDFEVNSKLFSEDEQKLFEEEVSKKSGEEFQICLPQRYNFPQGKSANEYLFYIMKDPLKWFNFDNSSKNSDDNSEEEVNEEEVNEEQVKKFIKKIEKSFDNKKEEEQIKEENLKETSKAEVKETEVKKETTTKIKNLKDKIIELLTSKDFTINKRDPIYYYNHNKFNSNVMFVKTRRNFVIQDKQKMTVLLDVSGSVSEEYISQFVNIFKNISNVIQKDCRIVFWNTKLVGDYSSKKSFPIYCGGGTDIAKGIRYVARDNRDILFVVSDCQDRLEDWECIYRERKYLICWDKSVKPYFEKSFINEWEKIIFVE